MAELDIWIGHVCETQGWRALMQIAPIEANGDRISRKIAALSASDPTVSVAQCQACKRDRMIMFNAAVGHCLYCRNELAKPIDDEESEEHAEGDPR